MCSLRPFRVASIDSALGDGVKAMQDRDNRGPPLREYPAFYEKAVPIALGIIALAIVILLLVIFGVALGLLPGSR